MGIKIPEKMKDSKYLNSLITGILIIAFASSQGSIQLQIGKDQFLRIENPVTQSKPHSK
ncbi:MAG: hypothetical protein M1G31_34170 [Pseudanabaena sp. Salubria-1]|nr:hypothetical protein [Pseudanabaena sp. Salubria-1]